MKTDYDAIVIGAGSGGLTSAVGLAKIGKSVLLVEREHIGGECTNSGCIPSKALLHHAKSYYQAIAISGGNSQTENYRRDAFSYVRAKIAETLSHETPEHFKKLGIDVVIGEAVFTSPSTIKIGSDSITFKKAVIATGSSPRMIVVPELDPSKILTNQNLFALESVPAHTLIIGAGPIGLEMGQALAMLGSNVTILDNGPTFARLEDEALRPIIHTACTKLGITILQNVSITSVQNNIATISQTDTTTTKNIPFDKVLIAIGRIPNLPQGLEAATIQYDNAGIKVSKNNQTSNRRVYALGDVADTLKFTHVADDTARRVVARIASFGIFSPTAKSVPKVTYTEPELAQVGLSQTEAVSLYGELNIHRIEVPFNQNDRARTDNSIEGTLVVIVKRVSGKILGVHIAGPRAGELLAVFSVAIDNNLSLWKLRRTMYAYPTYALIIKKAGDIFFATQINSLKRDIGYKFIGFLPKLLLLTAWLSGLYYLYNYTNSFGLTPTELAIALFDFITQTIWGPLLYILAYTIRPLTFFPGTALTILSGVFFGLSGGIFYTIIGANLSATVAYFVGRFFGKKTANVGGGIFGRFAESCRTNPFTTILTMRLLFLPYDGVNYGAGLLRVPFMPYIIATIVGSILGITTFVAIGASISVDEFKTNGITTSAINGSFLILSALIFVISLAVAKYLPKK